MATCVYHSNKTAVQCFKVWNGWSNICATEVVTGLINMCKFLMLTMPYIHSLN